MGSTPSVAVRGNKGLLFKVKIGAAAAVEYDGDVKKLEVTSSDKDAGDLTFGEVQTGDGKDYGIKITALYSTAVGSLWSLLHDNPFTEVVITWGPHGNAVPTTTEPHWTATVKTDGRPPHSVEARRTKQRESFEYEFGEMTAGPLKITA